MRLIILGLMLALCALAASSAGHAKEAIEPSALLQAAALVEAEYFDPVVGARVATLLRSNATAAAYGDLTGERLASKLAAELRDFTHDPHFDVQYFPQVLAGGGPDAAYLAQVVQREMYNNFGFYQVRRYPGNIGYLDLKIFADPREANNAARAVAISSLRFLATTDALIIDLRDNGGGEPEMASLLASFMLPPRTVLNTILYRHGKPDVYVTAKLDDLHYSDQHRVYILTSKDTFSAAEGFAYSLQALGRATVIGERTGGGANPAITKRIGPHLLLTIPNGKTMNQTTHSNWESSGVSPDISSPSDQAFAVAYCTELRKLEEHPSTFGVRQISQALVDNRCKR